MRQISLHIMDIAENGIAAGADLVILKIVESQAKNLLEITVSDNGTGISPGLIKKVSDPFFTTRTTRRVGLGLSLLKEASKRCGGEFHIRSEEGKGTDVYATFMLDHIDLAPVGDMGGSFSCLVMGNPGIDFVYCHEVNGRSFELDTRDLRKELEGVPVNHPKVLKYIADTIKVSLKELRNK